MASIDPETGPLSPRLQTGRTTQRSSYQNRSQESPRSTQEAMDDQVREAIESLDRSEAADNSLQGDMKNMEREDEERRNNAR